MASTPQEIQKIKTQDAALRRVVSKERENFRSYKTEGNKIAQEIFTAVSKIQSFKVNRWLIAGSIGKNTWLGKGHGPDFDLVLLIQHPLIISPEAVIAEIAKTIVESLPSKYRVVKTTKHTVQCECNSGQGKLEFDIVPGMNFVTNTANDKNQANTQLERVLQTVILLDEDMKKAVKQSPFLSASLAEYVVQFVSKQDEFTHNVVKLTKLWNKRIPDSRLERASKNGKKVNGRSFTMELVAIHAAQEEVAQHGKEKTLVGAFERAMTVFSKDRGAVRVIFPFPKGANPSQAKVKTQYDKMTRSSRVIMDPTNPYNNLMDNFEAEHWEIFRVEAKKCLDIIKKRDASIANCFP